jgi:PleD family two-component response regulator
LAEALAPFGFLVEPCPEIGLFFEAIERTTPSLVLVASRLGDWSGAELVSALKADARFRTLPTMVLSPLEDGPARLQALVAGADEVVATPYVPSELVAKATALLARQGREERAAVVDPLTGAFRRGYLLEACERALHLARRGRPLAMLVFDAEVQGAEEGGSLAAHEQLAAIAARLRQSFRVSDVLARLGAGRFAVLLHDVTKEDAEQLLQSNLELLRPSALSPGLVSKVRGALATFPEVGGGAESLLEAALRQLASE